MEEQAVKEVLEVIEKIKGSLMRREYKDSVFRYLFGRYENKENLLSLYNALNGTDYKNKDDLRINTIDGILSLGVHNDVSFILDSQMMLYEHQSTYCQNMPLRGLVYFTILYYKEIFNEKSIYNSKRLMIPTPRYVVFYNGQDKDLPDKVVQKLSDSFENPKDSDGFEWTATILNINYGHNKEILLKCRVLEEYSLFVQCVRKHFANEKDKDIAIQKAIDECINNNILRDFLTKCKAEVIGMLNYEDNVLREWEKLCKGYIKEGYEKRQPEVDAANKRADDAEQRTVEAEQRANDAEAGQVQMIMNMLSKGKTKEDIIDLTGITEERYIALMKIN